MLISTRDRYTVVTGVAIAIPILISLVWVIDARAVIALIRDAVSIRIMVALGLTAVTEIADAIPI